ncbi:metallophosphoesterase [Lachnotalea sp. AF33-28]|uniref:metallophosphoesterase n=1 Tax=Lachnotalea sp. AF33-28 TaxID=2292046 RepID=UPI0013140751|nr:metallophosphoesterase [Lachnotalea sp. AF33-28]
MRVRYMIVQAVLVLPLWIYLYFYFRRMAVLLIGHRHKAFGRLTAVILSAAAALPAANIWGMWALVVLHIAGTAAAVDLARLILVKVFHIKSRRGHILYCSGLIPILLTVLILSYGYVNMQHVTETGYTIVTGKELREEGYTAAFLSDLHFGTTMDKDTLSVYCGRIGENRPDFVILGGDIVDERTNLEQVREAFETLAQIPAPLGIYYVYGNHDKGRYAADCGYTEEQLREAVAGTGIRILEDETVELNRELTLTGRADRSDAYYTGIVRIGAGALLEGESGEGFHILADHQPNSLKDNALAGYDLMLSGHTHAGQIWPVGLLTELFGRDTRNYGYERIGGMDLIVSSGIAGWGYPFRTGKHCEYVIVRIRTGEEMQQ